MSAVHKDFSDLYRKALAERDPYHKRLLLHLVKEALEEWEKQSRSAYEQAASESEAMARIAGLGVNGRRA